MGMTKKPLIIRADGTVDKPVKHHHHHIFKSKCPAEIEKEKNLLLLAKLQVLQKKIEARKALELAAALEIPTPDADGETKGG